MAFVEDEALRAEIRARLDLVLPADQRNQRLLWKITKSIMEKPKNQVSAKERLKRKWKGVPVAAHIEERIVLGLAYPVLDAAVSRDPAHLLKAPFMVHPRTGKVCVPLDPETVCDVDPARIPAARDVCADPAVLGPYVRLFEEAFARPVHADAARI